MEGTPLHPLVFTITLLLGASLAILPRRFAMMPIVVAAVLIPPDQRIVVATLDFPMLRILVLFAITRVLIRNETKAFRLHEIDVLILLLMGNLLLAYSALYGTLPAFVNRLGFAFDLLGVYFLARFILRSWEDIASVVWMAGVCMIAVAPMMLVEWKTGRNPFSHLGGVSEYSLVREGRIRCQGAFSHPIMAGLFAASWAPLFWGLRSYLRWRFYVIAGLSSFLMTLLSASSTPLAGFAFGLIGIAAWKLRRWVPLARNTIIVLLVIEHFISDNGVWHLLSRFDLVGGSTGWHRYHLVDQAIVHWREWILVGTKDTAHWGHLTGDVTNEYVLTAVRGGLSSLLVFVAMLVACFRGLGKLSRARAVALSKRRIAWAFGAVLFLHAMSFLGVSYFGQLRLVWYLQLAMVGAVLQLGRAECAAKRVRKAPAVAGPETAPRPHSPPSKPAGFASPR